MDISPTFPEVLRQLKEWLKKHDLLDEDGEGLKNAMWVTDGVSLPTPSLRWSTTPFRQERS